VVGDIADGGEALAAVLGLQPDIVLLDIQLPNCDGFAVAEQEHDVLSLLAEGMSNRAVASRLFITERTVEAHVTQIFNKLGLADSADRHRRVLAVLAYLRT
jgi:DNA-binding NarL/FixJ family response regulator